METADDVRTLKSLIQRHLKFTGSDVARRILLGWDKSRVHFKKVFPREYRCVVATCSEALFSGAGRPAALCMSTHM